MTSPDPLAAALDQIRKRGYRNGATGAALLARLSDAAAVDVPLLLAAIETVLKLHVRRDKPVLTYHICAAHGPFGDDEGYNKSCAACRITEKYVCAHCRHECPDDDEWPCLTVRAITTALTGDKPAR